MENTKKSEKSLDIAKKVEIDKTDLRKILLYEFYNQIDVDTVIMKINQATGQNLVTKITVKRWYKKFENENWKLEDKPRKGRPRLQVNTDDIVEIINEDPSITISEISKELKISDKTIRKRLAEAHYVYQNRRWIRLENDMDVDENENDENVCYQSNE